MSSPQFYEWIVALLNTIKSNNIPPPQASRWFFLSCSLAWDALQYIGDSTLQAIDTSFQKSGKGTRCGSNMMLSFLFKAIRQSWTLLFTSYMNVDTIFIDQVWTSQSPLIRTYPQVDVQLAHWMSRTVAYLVARASDGSKTANIPPGPIFNSGKFIESTGYSSPDVIQDLSDIPDIQKWTPIKTGSSIQSYLVPSWGGVSPIVDVTAQTFALGDTFFPSLSKNNKEIADVLIASKNLSDQQKMIAEVWTAGSNTITPPGMWMFFAAKLAEYLKQDLTSQITMFKYVSAALFQAGISAWSLKWKYQQSRPIQNIRSTYNGQTGTIWTGTVDLGTWIPYQEIRGITPPHPDFVSGHSTFSAAAARVLDLYLRVPSIPTVQFNSTDLSLLSPIFASNVGKSCLNVFACYPGCSTHQPREVPVSGVTLSYNSWDEMASGAGISRIYGGIHVESSNQGGLAVGRMVGDAVFAAL